MISRSANLTGHISRSCHAGIRLGGYPQALRRAGRDRPDTPAMQRPPPSSLSLRLTTVHTRTGVVRDWCVRGAGTITWSQVADRLTAPDPAYVGAVLLDADTPLGRPPLTNEAIVSDAPARPVRPHLLQLVAIEGPCVGARAPLATHPMTVGRDAANHLVLQDSDLSRRHCEVRIEQGRARVRDTGSTNGTRIDGHPLGADFIDLRTGHRLRIGGTTLVIERATPEPEPTSTDETGRFLVHRSPRKVLHLDDVELTAPQESKSTAGRGFPWVSATVPLVLAAAMVIVLRNPLFAMFALLSPVMVVAQYVGDRGSSRGQRRNAASARAQATTDFEQACATALGIEQTIRRRLAPPITQAGSDAASRTPSVWQRLPGHPDHLSFRVGIGSVDSRVRVRSDAGASYSLRIADVPIVVSLLEHRVVGLSGPHRHQLAQGAIIQLATWQSPQQLKMVVLCSDHAAQYRWSPLRALPHLLPHPVSAPAVLVADPVWRPFHRPGCAAGYTGGSGAAAHACPARRTGGGHTRCRRSGRPRLDVRPGGARSGGGSHPVAGRLHDSHPSRTPRLRLRRRDAFQTGSARAGACYLNGSRARRSCGRRPHRPRAAASGPG